MDLKTFKKRLKEIRNQGYIRTLRAGNTGVGHTLEQLLNLRENNIATPDLGGKIELKVQRKSATNRITLFTKSPHWLVSPSKIISTYGYKNGKGRWALKITLTGKKEVSGLKLHFNQKTKAIQVINRDFKVLAFWNARELSKIFEMKLPKLIIVKAISRGLGKYEEFLYDEAYLLSGMNLNRFLGELQSETIVTEFRMHLKSEAGTIRDHGTGFRVAENKLDRIFKNKKTLI